MISITYFVHGTTTDNEAGLSTGWNSGELSELGMQQSKELAELVKEKKFDAVFSSDLKRAVDSAELAFGNSYEIRKDKRLRECNYGDWNGGEEGQVKTDMERRIFEPFPNGESYKDVEKRIAEFLDYLKQDFQGRHIAIVAHQAPQLALEVLLNGKSWEQAIREDWRLVGKWQPGWEYVIKI